MITIVNVKTAKPGTFEYCERANPSYKLRESSLANPFKLEKDTPDERNKAVAQYMEWLYAHLGDKPIATEIQRLVDIATRGDLALGCWCAPARCHCEVIREVILERMQPAQADSFSEQWSTILRDIPAWQHEIELAAKSKDVTKRVRGQQLADFLGGKTISRQVFLSVLHELNGSLMYKVNWDAMKERLAE